MILFEIRESDVYVYDGEKEATVPLSCGPGMWCRTIEALRKIPGWENTSPEDFNETIEHLYYYYRPDLLRGDVEKQERLGFFECPVCGNVYDKASFENYDPCDNCLYVEK